MSGAIVLLLLLAYWTWMFLAWPMRQDVIGSLNLVLLGGHTGAEVEGHDWERILGLTGLSLYDHRIAWTVHAIGAMMMVAGLVWGAVLVARNRA